jgi:2-amino-4-hydroxy-6-hydroxymethyldihydropteridine diphosphokinase
MILIALGSNLSSRAGGPKETLLAALDELAARGMTIVKRSGFYRSAAWPDPSDPPFVNAVASVRTSLDPSALLKLLHQVEMRFGRKRGRPNAPRTLDLDLIDYEGKVQDGPVILPHPRLDDRLFVLVPLREIAPGWRHPVTGRTVDELIRAAPRADVQLLSLAEG